MNKTFVALCCSVCCSFSLMAFSAAAAQQPTLNDVVKSQQGEKAFTRLIAGQNLPAWIKKGGVETPVQEVTLKGTTYQVYSSCKPHDCSSENFALLYSPADHSMSGLFVRNNESEHREQLQWLNLSEALSIDGKTVLYAAVTGSLANHPKDFNYAAK